VHGGAIRVSYANYRGFDGRFGHLAYKRPLSAFRIRFNYRFYGETLAGAAIDLARTTVRRAERRAVALAAQGGLPDSQVVPYLNRLADLLFVAARAADGGFRPVRSRE